MNICENSRYIPRNPDIFNSMPRITELLSLAVSAYNEAVANAQKQYSPCGHIYRFVFEAGESPIEAILRAFEEDRPYRPDCTHHLQALARAIENDKNNPLEIELKKAFHCGIDPPEDDYLGNLTCSFCPGHDEKILAGALRNYYIHLMSKIDTAVLREKIEEYNAALTKKTMWEDSSNVMLATRALSRINAARAAIGQIDKIVRDPELAIVSTPQIKNNGDLIGETREYCKELQFQLSEALYGRGASPIRDVSKERRLSRSLNSSLMECCRLIEGFEEEFRDIESKCYFTPVDNILTIIGLSDRAQYWLKEELYTKRSFGDEKGRIDVLYSTKSWLKVLNTIATNYFDYLLHVSTAPMIAVSQSLAQHYNAS